uniref:Dynein_C domain-containing protein n=1 Tax=Macrostomum lignano TaxID=282301 RepID=A0A1I8IR08_9PLAT
MEVCSTGLAKLGQPRTAPATETLTKVQQQQQPHPQQPAFAAWMMREFHLTQTLVTAVRDSLLSIKHALMDSASLGDCLSPEDTEAADNLQRFRLPARWSRLWGRGAPPPHYSLAGFLSDLTARQAQIDRALALGRARMPLYNLGLLAQPNTLLSLLLQEAAGRSPEAGLLISAELSSRDREHIRDPPTEGIFVHGLCLWSGCLEKGSWELLDAPPKAAGGFTPMPVLQLTCITQEARALAADPAKQGEVYSCPVYFSRHQQPAAAVSEAAAVSLPPQTPLFEVELRRDGVPSI